jgi:phospholipase A1
MRNNYVTDKFNPRLSLIILSLMASNAALADQKKYEDCLLREIHSASGDMTVEDLKNVCSTFKLDTVEPVSEALLEDEKQQRQIAAVDERLKRERQTKLRPWVLTPHKPNYFLPVSYNSDPYNEPFQDLPGNQQLELDDIEIKFQLSLKVPLVVGLLDDRVNIFAAYTNTSWWQAYNKDASSPFRETDHEPEFFITMSNDWNILGFTNRLNTLGIVHESNGRSKPLSRSWNRIYAAMIFERGGLGVAVRPWYRIKEDADIDNNPDITDYMGYGDITFAYKSGRQTFTAMARKKAFELTWSRLTWGNIRLYAQYFNGYGESLIEYDNSSNVFGIGFAFSDWL